MNKIDNERHWYAYMIVKNKINSATIILIDILRSKTRMIMQKVIA